jgi:hypothetical protein
MISSLLSTKATHGLALLFISVLLLSACVGEPEAGGQELRQPTGTFETVDMDSESGKSDAPSSGRDARDCPGVESGLMQIVTSADPLAKARERGLTIDNNRIQVLLVLDSAETDFLETYDVQAGKLVGSELQAFVATGDICELAKNEKVLAILLPASAVTQ